MAWNDWATKWWKKDKKKDKKAAASSYWYDDYSSDFDYGTFYKGWDGVDQGKIKSYQRTQDLYKLNATRRAISNFVNIVTNRNIPVTYATRSSSHTDGQSVVLSADINDHFDVGVGLALHEGSHIILSEFDLLQTINDVKMSLYGYMVNTSTPDKVEYNSSLKSILGNRTHLKHRDVVDRIFNVQTGVYRHSWPTTHFDGVIQLVHAITNWIEDRRIDAYIYKNAPGYRQYYLTMYDYYFNSADVTKGLESDEYTDETVDSYIYRIINFTNEKSDLSKLKGLRKIHGMIDLRNINRLKTTTDCMNLAIDVIEEIYKNCGQPMFDKSNQQGQGQGDGDGQGDSIEITDIADGDSDEQGGSSGQVGSQMGGQMSSNPSSQGKDADDKQTKPKTITLSKTALEKLKRAIEKQKQFLNDGPKKKKISKDEEKSLKTIEESDSQIVNVGADVKQRDYYGSSSYTLGKGVDCVVVKRVTDSVLKSEDFPFNTYEGRFDKEVAEGIKFGTILGNKLKVRSESRDTVYNRLNQGKIDQRLISGLGYGAESVFYTKEVDQYKKANLHISVDYSGSMSGNRLSKAVTAVTAIVKAAQLARNINVQVSIRSTTSSNRTALPYIALIYDSRKDSFQRFTKVISQIGAGNTTPEGLCYEAIMKHFVQSDKDTDSYFLNFSDGEPQFSVQGFSYSGEEAAQHTYRQIKRMNEFGVEVLSYFINDGEVREDSRSWQIFRKSYGTGAKWIDTKNMVAVARTMNELFLKKGGRD